MPPAAAPIRLLDQRWSAIYTTPQTYNNRLNFVNAVGSHNFSDTLNIKANAYYRGFRQKHVDGNTSTTWRECSLDPAIRFALVTSPHEWRRHPRLQSSMRPVRPAPSISRPDQR